MDRVNCGRSRYTRTSRGRSCSRRRGDPGARYREASREKIQKSLQQVSLRRSVRSQCPGTSRDVSERGGWRPWTMRKLDPRALLVRVVLRQSCRRPRRQRQVLRRQRHLRFLSTLPSKSPLGCPKRPWQRRRCPPDSLTPQTVVIKIRPPSSFASNSASIKKQKQTFFWQNRSAPNSGGGQTQYNQTIVSRTPSGYCCIRIV